MFHLIWVGGSYPSWVAQVMLLYLGILEKHIKSTSRVPRILAPDLGRPTKFKTPGPKVMFLDLGSSKSSNSSKHRAPTVMFLYLESSKSSKSSKSRVPTAMFLYLGRSKNKKKQMQRLFSQLVFFKACHWPAWSACCFSWSGISSVELPICLLSLAREKNRRTQQQN